MKTLRKKILTLVIIEAVLLMPVLTFSQNRVSSREMEQAIRLYQEGKDNDAMDRFMDILVKGSPSEKSLANEYISKITMRMNTGVDTIEDNTRTSVKNIPEQKTEEKIETKNYVGAETKKTSSAESAKANEDVATKIYKKIEEMRREILLSMSKMGSFRIFMADQNTPVGVLIDENEVFSSGTTFKPKAIDELQILSSLFFTAGKATITIIPKGGATGEIEIASIRRAIAINSYLLARGLSPARLNVNLTGSNIRLPSEINNVNGILCLMQYDKENSLKSEDDMKTGGPKVSLGVYPTAISAQKGEGSIVEFSVFEGSRGSPSWKFEIFRVNADNTLVPLTEIAGQGPKYNQTFFNGREKFFGAFYPSGRYIFSISASDTAGKNNSEKRFLLIKPTAEEEKTLAGASQGKVLSKPAVTPAAKKTATQKAKLPSKKGVSSKGASAKAALDEDRLEQVTYKIYFVTGKMEITPNSKKKLETIASTMDNYPESQISITGYSYKKEKNPKTMAKKRADLVKKELVNKYGVTEDNIKQSSIVSPTLKTIVEVKLIQE